MSLLVEHNVETGEIREIEVSESDLHFDINPQIIAMREANEQKEAARKAILEKLGLTAEEAELLLS